MAVHVADAMRTDLTLDRLTRRSPGALRSLYEGGRVPDLPDLNGSPHGRMLALAGAAGWRLPRGLTRRLAARGWFPWRGKNFQAQGAQGSGINRIRLLGSRTWYPFRTRVEPSALDGRPCAVLDYDAPENPWFIRKIRDELREVGEGLFLGPALFMTDAPRLVLWFAVDTGRPDAYPD